MIQIIDLLVIVIVVLAIFLIFNLYMKISKKVDLEVDILKQEYINLKENQSILHPIDHVGTTDDIHTMVSNNSDAMYDRKMDNTHNNNLMNNSINKVSNDGIDASAIIAQTYNKIISNPRAHLADKYKKEADMIETIDNSNFDIDDDFFVPSNVLPKTKKPR